MRAAMFTVFPKRRYLGNLLPTTPATTWAVSMAAVQRCDAVGDPLSPLGEAASPVSVQHLTYAR